MKIKREGVIGIVKLLILIIVILVIMLIKIIANADNNKFYADIPLDKDLQQYINDKCEESNISYDFVLAVIETESNYNASAKSTTNDYGLMQLNKIALPALKNIGVTNLLDPYQNIDAGMYFLTKYFEKYKDPYLVLMCYNLGEGGARKKWNAGITETEYCKKVCEKAMEIEKTHEKEN